MELILRRIQYFKALKAKTLSLKKSERTESIKEIDRTISRLKTWTKQLGQC